MLDAVGSWLASGERRFLLVGDAGTGKSAIAARLVEISRGVVGCEHPRLAAGFVSAAHFCRAREDQTLDPTPVLEHLSLQLAARYSRFREALQREAERPDVTLTIEGTAIVQTAVDSEVSGVRVGSLDVAGISAREAFDRCLRRPLDALCAERSEPVVILIDALDEVLSYEARSNLVEVLRKATDTGAELPRQVRFLFTSRHDPRLTEEVIVRLDVRQVCVVVADRSAGDDGGGGTYFRGV